MRHSSLHEHCAKELLPAVTSLCETAAALSRLIAKGGCHKDLGAAVGDNFGGDQQKALDVIADDAFRIGLADTDVRFYASEEQDEVVEIDSKGSLALAIDPLDGSSNIDVNVSIGTIFSIFPAAQDAERSFLRPAHEQIAAGYVIFGPQTVLCVTFGKGTLSFILNQESGEFEQMNADMLLRSKADEFAINASNYRHWPAPIRAYIDDCLAGSEGPRGKNFNMRWVASLVAETHRILTRGGVFLYPGDQREGYARGRLRHVYECAPIAMLIEQAGGMATDGIDRIMDQTPTGLHARTPFVFGSSDKVQRVRSYHDLPASEISALFGSRGLFRP